MTEVWDLVVDRKEFGETKFVDRSIPAIGDGEVLLKVDRVGMTANNVTYALMGEPMGYWGFFPSEDGGRVPLWGFCDVLASKVDGIEVGERFYGYLPTSSHLVVRPERVGEFGFSDGTEHRAALPSVYNSYQKTSADPAYDVANEDLQILYRPLFITSFMLDDFLEDNDFFNAQTILVSSASSKTSYAAAFCIGLRDPRPKVIGLTSKGNVDFTKSLGCYDEVVSYEEVTGLDVTGPVVYLDMAGSVALRKTVHEHFGDSLVYDAVVGATHMEASFGSGGDLAGPAPKFFFAPDQINKRREDWGPGGIEKRYGVAWFAFVPVVKDWVDVKVGRGRDALRSAWLEVLSGKSDPRVGNVIDL